MPANSHNARSIVLGVERPSGDTPFGHQVLTKRFRGSGKIVPACLRAVASARKICHHPIAITHDIDSVIVEVIKTHPVCAIACTPRQTWEGKADDPLPES